MGMFSSNAPSTIIEEKEEEDVSANKDSVYNPQDRVGVWKERTNEQHGPSLLINKLWATQKTPERKNVPAPAKKKASPRTANIIP